MRRNIQRENSVRKKWTRVKEGKFTSNAERVKLEDVGVKKSGFFLDTRIGINNVYKKRTSKRPSFSFNPLLLFMEMLDEKGTRPLREVKSGYKTINRAKLPVTKFKGMKTIRRNRYAVFEKAATIKKAQLPMVADEIAGIIKKAAEKGVFFDSQARNFGINKEGKVVITDTNYTKKYLMKDKAKIKEEMTTRFLDGLKADYVDKKVIEQFEKKLRQ